MQGVTSVPCIRVSQCQSRNTKNVKIEGSLSHTMVLGSSTVCSLIWAVSFTIIPIWFLSSLTTFASSIHCQYFSEVLTALKMKDYQLLHDVNTCWSSNLILIDCALLLQWVSNHTRWSRQKILNFAGYWKLIQRSGTEELQKWQMASVEWDALSLFKLILEVMLNQRSLTLILINL